MEETRTHFDLVTFDAVNSEALATFWAKALGLGVVESEDNGRWIVLGSTSGSRTIGVQRIAGLTDSDAVWAGPTKPRVHLDLACDPEDFAAEVERLVELGAKRLRPDRVEYYGSIATLVDPEGNLFDLCAYVPH